MSRPVKPHTERHPQASILSRREVLAVSLAGAAGAAIASPLSARAAGATQPRRAVIRLIFQGGLSHLESFDPKPDAPSSIHGPFGVIPTRVDGLRFCELWPHTAELAHRLCLIRSISHPSAAHDRAMHLMLHGRLPETPAIRSISAGEAGAPAGRVVLPGPEAGYGYAGGVSPTQWHAAVRNGSTANDTSGTIRPMREPEAVRTLYGRNPFGERCLTARQLVQAGANEVNVFLDGWDMHRNLRTGMEWLAPLADQAFAALFHDLDEHGLLETTLVVLMSEFGRTPRLNKDGGRDHGPGVFSVLVAGGDSRGGVVIGESDATGEAPLHDPVTPAELCTAIRAWAQADSVRLQDRLAAQLFRRGPKRGTQPTLI